MIEETFGGNTFTAAGYQYIICCFIELGMKYEHFQSES